METTIYTEPLPNIPIIEPANPPNDGEEIIGYELLYANKKWFTRASPRRMNTAGWVSVVLLFIFFWPATCLPCFTTCSYNECQRPVYGFRLKDIEEQTLPLEKAPSQIEGPKATDCLDATSTNEQQLNSSKKNLDELQQE
jgi:hypothetical protein